MVLAAAVLAAVEMLLLGHQAVDSGPLEVGSADSGPHVAVTTTAGPGLFGWGDPLINHGDQPVTLVSIRLGPAASHLAPVDARAWPAAWGRNTSATVWPFSSQPGFTGWADRTYPELAGYVIPPHGDAWSMVIFAADVRGRYQWTTAQVAYRMGGHTYTASGGLLRTLCVPAHTACPDPYVPGKSGAGS